MNPGGIFGRFPVNRLGEVHPDTRNPVLVSAFELYGESENRFSGIPTVRRLMREARLPEPQFSVVHGMFKATLFNGEGDRAHPNAARVYAGPRQDAYDIAIRGMRPVPADQRRKTPPHVERFIIDYCIIPRTRDQIARELGVQAPYAMRKYIRPLVDRGVLELGMPDKPQSPKQTFRTRVA